MNKYGQPNLVRKVKTPSPSWPPDGRCGPDLRPGTKDSAECTLLALETSALVLCVSRAYLYSKVLLTIRSRGTGISEPPLLADGFYSLGSKVLGGFLVLLLILLNDPVSILNGSSDDLLDSLRVVFICMNSKTLEGASTRRNN